MKDLQKPAAVTPISSHRRYAMKTEAPVKSWAETVKPRASNVEETTDMDSVAAIAHIRQCAWIIAHRHGVLTVTEMLQLLQQELLTGFNGTPNGA